MTHLALEAATVQFPIARHAVDAGWPFVSEVGVRETLLRELFRTLLHDLLTARRRVTGLDLMGHFVDASKMVRAATT